MKLSGRKHGQISMNWFKKRRARNVERAREQGDVDNATIAVIEIIMRNLGNVDQCWPDLDGTGLSREAISKIYNLTVIACAQEAVEALLPKSQIPDNYVVTDESGAEQTVRFNECGIYLTARALALNNAQAAASIASGSEQLKIIGVIAGRLGGATKENIARVVLLPVLFHPSGQAAVRATMLPVVGGASAAIKRRAEAELNYFKGNGIDVGGGEDSIDQYAAQLGFDSCRNWDMADGDAQYLPSVPDGAYDFLHSSHCLEHMVDPKIALANWVRVVRPGGYIVVIIPDEEMYEHLRWPSICNEDHKWSFTIYRGIPRLPKSVNVFNLLIEVWSQVEIIKIERLEGGYRDNLGDTDQTAFGTSECAIEFILRKISATDSSDRG